MSLPLLSSSLAAHHNSIVALFNKAAAAPPKLLVKQPVIEVEPSPTVDYRDSSIPFLALNADFIDFLQQNIDRLSQDVTAVPSLKPLKNMVSFTPGSYYLWVEDVRRFDFSQKTWILFATLTETEVNLLPDALPENRLFFNIPS